jgi:hypothetical protein
MSIHVTSQDALFLLSLQRLTLRPFTVASMVQNADACVRLIESNSTEFYHAPGI